MKNILLVCSRNLVEDSGESALISRRAEALENIIKQKTDVFLIRREKKIRDRKYYEENRYYSKKYLMSYKLTSFFKELKKFRKLLENYLLKEKPEEIIVSGIIYIIFYKDLLVKYKKANKVKIYYDMHGCLEELIEYPIRSKIFSYLIYYYLNKIEKNILETLCDTVLIVSNEMKNYISQKYNLKKESICIPCGINELKIDREKERKKWRKQLGIKESEKICVYSGGISKWQMLEESIEFYEKKLKALKIKMMIFTKNVKKVEEILIQNKYDRKNYILKSLTRKDVIPALTSADIAIMLREKNETNRVAFPNKFSEYLMAGLYIITTKNVKAQEELIQKYGVGTFIEEQDSIKSIKKILEIERKIKYIKCDEIIKNDLEYSKYIKKWKVN